MAGELRFGPIGPNATHLCVDMQTMFVEETPWATPWMKRILPKVEELASERADRTVFTRFIPLRRPEEGRGAWRRYYRRWQEMTLDRIDPRQISLVPPLERLVPPAELFDKRVYSPWLGAELDCVLRSRGIDTIVISGGETEICVLATVLGAVDLGYRVIIADDALCSSSDDTHDALMKVYHERFTQQLEMADVETILANWR